MPASKTPDVLESTCHGHEGRCNGCGEVPRGDGAFHRPVASVLWITARSGRGCRRSQALTWMTDGRYSCLAQHQSAISRQRILNPVRLSMPETFRSRDFGTTIHSRVVATLSAGNMPRP